MDIKNFNFDKEYTNSYRDKYNEQCQCEYCMLFRENFSTCYSKVVKFLMEFGINIDFPLEIMEFDIDDSTLKRKYVVYYAVKGKLPTDEEKTVIDHVTVTMKNDNVITEYYPNTAMESPFFIIELGNILLKDNKSVFVEALNTGREMEFSFADNNYFLSRNKLGKWYIYCEQTKETQTFATQEELLKGATLYKKRLSSIWNKITIDCLL